MQAYSRWAPPGGTLGRLVAEARERAEALRGRSRELGAAAADAPPALSFRGALQRPDVAIIAEVKRRSPSKGDINPALSAARQAAAYAEGGAAALSILTEPKHFGGAAADLTEAQTAVSIPLLKKDFHVSRVQLVEARALGASAALLIARALPPEELEALAGVAAELGLEALVEVRDEGELDRALKAGAVLVGVNNRDLETLAIDATTSERLIPLIPPDRVAIGESGVRDRGDVVRMAGSGADAVLVGSSISAADDPRAAVRALVDVPRLGRGR